MKTLSAPVLAQIAALKDRLGWKPNCGSGTGGGQRHCDRADAAANEEYRHQDGQPALAFLDLGIHLPARLMLRSARPGVFTT